MFFVADYLPLWKQRSCQSQLFCLLGFDLADTVLRQSRRDFTLSQQSKPKSLCFRLKLYWCIWLFAHRISCFLFSCCDLITYSIGLLTSAAHLHWPQRCLTDFFELSILLKLVYFRIKLTVLLSLLLFTQSCAIAPHWQLSRFALQVRLQRWILQWALVL